LRYSSLVFRALHALLKNTKGAENGVGDGFGTLFLFKFAFLLLLERRLPTSCQKRRSRIETMQRRARHATE
jgi:hypothetical protein